MANKMKLMNLKHDPECFFQAVIQYPPKSNYTQLTMEEKQKFIHAFDLTSQMVCHNLVFTKRLCSPDTAIPTTASDVFSLREIDLDVLKNADNVNAFVSPRAGVVIQGNWARRGLKIGIGVNDPPRWYSDDTTQRFKNTSELELEFEKIRRKICPRSASRLCCIYLAEDSEDGRMMLKRMFGPGRFIASIKIDFALRLTRVDSRWVDKYASEKKQEFIENYWLGAETDDPQIEYLLEGTIILRRKEDHNIIDQYHNQLLRSGGYGSVDKTEYKKRLASIKKIEQK